MSDKSNENNDNSNGTGNDTGNASDDNSDNNSENSDNESQSVNIQIENGSEDEDNDDDSDIDDDDDDKIIVSTPVTTSQESEFYPPNKKRKVLKKKKKLSKPELKKFTDNNLDIIKRRLKKDIKNKNKKGYIPYLDIRQDKERTSKYGYFCDKHYTRVYYIPKVLYCKDIPEREMVYQKLRDKLNNEIRDDDDDLKEENEKKRKKLEQKIDKLKLKENLYACYPDEYNKKKEKDWTFSYWYICNWCYNAKKPSVIMMKYKSHTGMSILRIY